MAAPAEDADESEGRDRDGILGGNGDDDLTYTPRPPIVEATASQLVIVESITRAQKSLKSY